MQLKIRRAGQLTLMTPSAGRSIPLTERPDSERSSKAALDEVGLDTVRHAAVLDDVPGDHFGIALLICDHRMMDGDIGALPRQSHRDRPLR